MKKNPPTFPQKNTQLLSTGTALSTKLDSKAQEALAAFEFDKDMAEFEGHKDSSHQDSAQLKGESLLQTSTSTHVRSASTKKREFEANDKGNFSFGRREINITHQLLLILR
jgi:hypothetical protein